MLPSEKDKKEICGDLLQLIAQYDVNREQVIAQVETDKLISQPDEVPLTHTAEPATVEEARSNIRRDIRVLRGRCQSYPLDLNCIQQVFGVTSGVGKIVYTEPFKQEARRIVADKRLEWAEQEFPSKPGVLQLKGERMEYKLVRKEVTWYKELSDKPEDKLENLDLLRKRITEDIRIQFGDFDRIISLVISGGQLIMNGVMYVPLPPTQGYEWRLPLDVMDYLKSGCIAGVFDFSSLYQMKRLYSFYCDDIQFYTLNIADDLGLGRRIGISSLFRICPGLEELTIGDETLKREDLYKNKSKQIKENIRQMNLFHKITDGYKFNIYAGTDGLQSFAFSNLKNYATNRGDKGLIRYCIGTISRTTFAAGATAVNFLAHTAIGLGKALLGLEPDSQ